MQHWISMVNTITLARLGNIFENREKLPYKVKELLPTNSKSEVELAEQFYRKQIEEVKSEGRIIPFERLCEICEYDHTTKRLLELSLAIYTYPQIKELFRWMGREEAVTLELVQELFLGNEEETLTYQKQKRSYKLLSRILKPIITGDSFLSHCFSMDERVYGYLLGDWQPEEELEIFLNPEPAVEEPQLWIHEKQAKELEEYFLSNVSLFQLRGEPGTGKRHLAHFVCEKYNFPLIEVNGKKLGYLEIGKLKEVIWKLKREILLQEAALCVYGIEQESKEGKGWQIEYLMEEVILPLLETDYPIFVCSDTKTNLTAATERFMGQILLEPLSRMERHELWKGFSVLWRLQGLEEEVLSSKFRLNASEIKKVAKRLSYWQEKEELTEERIHQECVLLMKDDAMGTLKKEKSPQTLEELKLPEAQKDIIRHIVSHITYRYQVYDQWNLEKKYPYGKTVSALFTGPPGTGKTMAAHVIANMLKLPLYSVDLSQVVDKYIGETQKRLEEIFMAAERSSSILFFDEADAIFGKRSEVNDSKDRYANAEVAYILQRMEQYDGVVIMASNLLKNIDEAFMRRIRYLVHFEMPDEKVRKELWMGCFPKETPQENIDFDFLAKTFEFSGGSIKNVVLNSVFLAAEEGTKVGMSQIIRSIKHEYIKQGKSVFVAEFGVYGYYLHGSQND